MSKGMVLFGLFVVTLAIAALVSLWIGPVPASRVPPMQTTVSVSPNGHVVRVIVNHWTSITDVDAEIDKALEDHPELFCTSVNFSTYGNLTEATLLCSKVSPPAENAQDQTGPP